MGVLEWLITRHTGRGEALGGRGAPGPEGSTAPENPSPREWGSTGSSLVGSSGRGVWVPCLPCDIEVVGTSKYFNSQDY